MLENVDILMAVYNGKRYLQEQIESILIQDYPHFHILIRDDGSSDGTQELINEYVNKYPDKIRLIESSQPLGAQGNFSELMQASQSPYIMLSDQDDVWRRDKISKTLAKMKETEKMLGNKKPVLIHTDLVVVDADLKLIHPSFWRFSRCSPHRHHSLNRLLVQNVVTGCTCMMNRPLLNVALPIPKETIMHDWWLALVASAFGTIRTVSGATMFYRQHQHNVLGAQSYGSLQYLRNGVKKLWAPNPKKVQQAEEFYRRYALELSRDHLELLKTYLSLPERSFLSSRLLMLKHRFLKQGLIRKAGAFLFQRTP